MARASLGYKDHVQAKYAPIPSIPDFTFDKLLLFGWHFYSGRGKYTVRMANCAPGTFHSISLIQRELM